MLWKLKGYGPPTPREIRHFYTLRQSGHGGTYFLLSTPVENWISEGTVNPEPVEVSDDEKKKGFIWGLPSSNKWWKNSWFIISGAWRRDVPASTCRNLPARRVPQNFTSPDSWSKTQPVLSDVEIAHVATIAATPLAERGFSELFDEEKMIGQNLFSRLPARFHLYKNLYSLFLKFLLFCWYC